MENEYFYIKRELEFIYVTANKPVTAESIQVLCSIIPTAAREEGVFKILIDGRQVNTVLTTVERFKYAALIALHFRGLKIAVILDYPTRDPTGFGESVARKLGANISICNTLEEASEWLHIVLDSEQIAAIQHVQSRR